MWKHAYRSLNRQQQSQLFRHAAAASIAASCVLGEVGSRTCSAGSSISNDCCDALHIIATVARCESEAEGNSSTRPGRKEVTFRKRRLSIVPDAEHDESENDTIPPSDADQKDMATMTTNEQSQAKQPTMKTSYAIEIESAPSSRSSSLKSKVSEKRKIFAEFLSELGIKALEDGDDEEDLKDLRKHHHTTFAHPSSMGNQELAFPDDKVGAFSAHGIEPHPYIVREEASILFSSNVEPQIVTLITQKINQDRGIVVQNFARSDQQTALFGVFDGHGRRGERVADYVMHEIPNRLRNHPKYQSNLHQAFVETYLSVDADIKRKADIEPYHSGSTACVVVLQGSKLTVSNVGDSRAVIGRRRTAEQGGGNATYSLPGGPTVDLPRMRYDSISLTKDQNAKDPVERRRVLKSGGFVAEPREPGLPARIYLDKECTLVGLAMSRSLGDHNMKKIGVIANPVITHHVVADQDEFLILASDGVWEFISSEEAVRIVGDCLDKGLTASEASIQLIRHAMKLWKKIEGDYRDDITAIVVRLPQLFD